MAGRHRIMIVDDNEATREFLEAALSGDYETVLAQDGFDALEKLAKTEPDLLILDVVMPLMNGFETCRCVRKNPSFRSTEVIFLSARDDDATIKRTYESGGNLFIQKPIEADRLLRNIKASLEKVGAPRRKRYAMEQLRGIFQSSRAEAPREASAPAPPPSPSPALTQKEEFLSAPELSAKASAPSPPRPRIMVVDDDNELATLLELTLQEEYEMLSAANGVQAIERIIDFQPDILLVDVMMPKMNGYQLCQSLRRNPTYRDTPILFLTAKSGRKDREYGERCGADAYITKPFDMRKLQELLRVIAAKPEFIVRPKTFNFHEVKNKMGAEARDVADRRQIRGKAERYGDMRDVIERAEEPPAHN